MFVKTTEKNGTSAVPENAKNIYQRDDYVVHMSAIYPKLQQLLGGIWLGGIMKGF